MSQGKCNLLKPVVSLTGTFFMFSQYAQDLTKQYTQNDSYRCVPSKFAAFNLDLSNYTSGADKELGNIFQDYFENACTFLRSKYETSWNPEYTRTLLFQTLQKYDLMHVTNSSDTNDNSFTSKQLQCIGDINIYSYDELKDGIGFNEIYCYINNSDKCMDYQLESESAESAQIYNSTYICGYEGQEPYNELSYMARFDKSVSDNSNVYCIGKYGTDDLSNYTFVPTKLKGETSSDTERKEGGSSLNSFPINCIVVFYDIVNKNGENDDVTTYKNIPLGIYFTGAVQSDGTMTNSITKYVSDNDIYNQGTSYGLRICSRFLTAPNSAEKIEVSTTSQSNVSELAPVLEKMGETLASVQDIVTDDDKMYSLVQDHLSMFKNYKVNVPYVRYVGTKKYWFVNGKNTGAVAQYEVTDADEIIKTVYNMLKEEIVTKTNLTTILEPYLTRTELDKEGYAKSEDVNNQISDIVEKIKVWLQGE